MQLRQHVLYGGAASVVLFPVLGLTSVAFWVGSVLIDADHYLEYIYHNRLTDFSVRGMYDYYHILGNRLTRPEFLNLSIFHTVEFLTLFYLWAEWLGSPMLKAALWGMLFHLLLDTIHLARLGVATKRAYSIIEFLVRKELMRRKGLHPFTVIGEALDLMRQGVRD